MVDKEFKRKLGMKIKNIRTGTNLGIKGMYVFIKFSQGGVQLPGCALQSFTI